VVSTSDIKVLVSNMTDDLNLNLEKIKQVFGSATYTDDTKQDLLHILVDNKYEESKCLLAIRTLLEVVKLNPNYKDEFEYNFIQTALYAGYSENFILNIIKEALKYGLDVNHVDSDKDTMVHTAIYSDDYLGEVINIYKLLARNGFDSNKVDGTGKSLMEAMLNPDSKKRYSKSQIEEFKDVFFKVRGISSKAVQVNNENYKIHGSKQSVPNVPLSESEIKALEKYGKVLNLVPLATNPTVNRERELQSLILSLAQDIKNPIIVGESGVGKTALVEELVYRIQRGEVPDFLKNKIILEISPSKVVSGCTYVGEFEEAMNQLMDLCVKYNALVFIDEIHTIFGTGSSSKNDNDMSDILKYYIDRFHLKVIGTTTSEEYDKYFKDSAFKRRFEKVIVKEPTNEELYPILEKVLNDYLEKNHMVLENEDKKRAIIKIMISKTDKRHRLYNNMLNHPALAVSLIDKAFACAKLANSCFIKAGHFAEAFELCDDCLSSFAKEDAVLELNTLDKDKKDIKKEIPKIIKINFKRH